MSIYVYLLSIFLVFYFFVSFFILFCVLCLFVLFVFFCSFPIVFLSLFFSLLPYLCRFLLFLHNFVKFIVNITVLTSIPLQRHKCLLLVRKKRTETWKQKQNFLNLYTLICVSKSNFVFAIASWKKNLLNNNTITYLHEEKNNTITMYVSSRLIAHS